MVAVAEGEATSHSCATIAVAKDTLPETANCLQQAADATVTEDGIIATIMSAVTTDGMTGETTAETIVEEIGIGDKIHFLIVKQVDNEGSTKITLLAQFCVYSEHS